MSSLFQITLNLTLFNNKHFVVQPFYVPKLFNLLIKAKMSLVKL